ncbi:hypothetical protein C7H19_11195 [Aphanothece hegewaldii CCALA 016]|uniref:DUF2301 domain-containing membrane protein n=1 Tax=Aphanothece hegewaldii CCALA 016 TaxID=2107694 RepID=A0A2T1LY09_9CHRO|nr:DUF2301 domain-containing membrane protein [Aphanothece hegewaldii]PSF37275.1 hypothetical protein C7H19_11195 [Aphanothece hegewaldii CCALA 016]
MLAEVETQVYQGQFGNFTITDHDRNGVILYRSGLVIAALSFLVGSSLVFWGGNNPEILQLLTPLFFVFSGGLALSLATIHIYFIPLHRLLQLFLGIGTISFIVLTFKTSTPVAEFIYTHPFSLLGIGFTFAALTGIYFKEAFCFNRLETKILTPLVPLLLLGHLFGILPVTTEKLLLSIWSILFLVFAMRKVIQPIPPDIGDKSVFDYLKQQKVSQGISSEH